MTSRADSIQTPVTPREDAARTRVDGLSSGSARISRREIDYARLKIMEGRRGEMVADLITNRRFNPVGAALAVDNFLAMMRYVLEQTGALPK